MIPSFREVSLKLSKKVTMCHTPNDQIHKTMISYIFHSKHKNVLGGRAARYDFLNIIIEVYTLYEIMVSIKSVFH